MKSTVGIPDRIDVDVLGSLHLLTEHSSFDRETDSLNLLLSGASAQLVAWHDGSPVQIRSLGPREELTGEVVLEELQQARIPLETAFPGAASAQLHLWVGGDVPSWLQASPLLSHLQIHEWASPFFATAGAAERSRLPEALNLVPTRWRQEAEARRHRQKLLKTAAIAFGVWALLLGGLIGWTFYRSWKLEALEELNEQYTAAMTEIRVLSDQVRSLSYFTDRSQSALELMRILAESVPSSAKFELEELRYRKQRDHVFTGTFGQRLEPFNRFLEALEANERISIDDWSTKQTRTGNEFRFETSWVQEEGP
jgi:hypothetical protein